MLCAVNSLLAIIATALIILLLGMILVTKKLWMTQEGDTGVDVYKRTIWLSLVKPAFSTWATTFCMLRSRGFATDRIRTQLSSFGAGNNFLDF